MQMKLRKCRKCGVPFEIKPDGRPRKFCSNSCRQSAYRRRRGKSVLFRSESDNWATNPALFAKYHKEFNFTLDACASAENAKCAHYFTAEQDGLKQTWTGRVWCNPPYGHAIGQWVRKAYESVHSGSAEVVALLLPSNTDTAWFHEYCVRGEIRFLEKRQRFGDMKYPAPFASVLVVFRNAKVRYESA
jgi:phage N-6-adenine-methyltransferase